MPGIVCTTFCVAFEVAAATLPAATQRDIAVACGLSFDDAAAYAARLVRDGVFLPPPIYIGGIKFSRVYQPRVVCKELMR